jgi:outer membrane cobalamin receptor
MTRNLVTRRPAGNEAAAEAAYGTWHTARAAVYAGTGRTGDHRLVVGAQTTETDGHLQPQGNTGFSDAATRHTAVLGEKTLGRTTVAAAWAYYDWDRHSPSATLPGAPLSTQFEKGNRQHLHLGVEQQVADGLMLTLTQLRNESTERGAPALGAGSVFNQRVVNDGSLAQLTWDTGANLVSFGAEYQEARLTDRTAGRKYRGRTHGFFIQDRLLLWRDQLSLTAGLRHDETSTYDEADLSPKLGVSFQPARAAWRVRANYGEAFKSPTFTQTYSTRPPLGNTALVAQSFELVEAGADWQPHRSLRLGATIYRGELADPIYPRAQATPPFLLQFVNVSPGTRTDGFYLTALWQPAPGWRVDTSYAYLDPGTLHVPHFPPCREARPLL